MATGIVIEKHDVVSPVLSGRQRFHAISLQLKASDRLGGVTVVLTSCFEALAVKELQSTLPEGVRIGFRYRGSHSSAQRHRELAFR
jgi:hypothetical protein